MSNLVSYTLAGIITFTLLTFVTVWLFILMGWFILLLAGALGAWLGVSHKRKEDKKEVDNWMEHLGVKKH